MWRIFGAATLFLVHADSDSTGRNLVMLPQRNVDIAFTLLDSNRSGSLDKEELNRLVKHLSHKNDASELENSSMSKEEFVEFVEDLRLRELKEEFYASEKMTMKNMLKIILKNDKHFEKYYG
jgi:hypothetical protein